MSTQDAVKKAGLKATLPRMLILEVLTKTINSEVHLSAEDIYKELLTSGDDVGLATVYRVLSQFESAGIVTRHNFEEGHSVYEMTQDHLDGFEKEQLSALEDNDTGSPESVDENMEEMS